MRSLRLASSFVRGTVLPLVLAGGCAQSRTLDGLPTPGVAPISASLATASSCDDLLARLRADAQEKADVEAYRLVATYDEGGYRGGPIWYAADGVPPTAGAPTPGTGGTSGSDTTGPTSYTETNTQVPGVDEADFVETDGTHVYLLHGQSFLVLASWPATSTAIRSTTTIEGAPVAMFVANGRAAVFSSVFDASSSGGTSGGSAGGAPTPIYPGYGYGRSFTKITVLDVTQATPAVVAERYLEGSYTDARRRDDVVRVLVQSWLPGPWSIESEPSAWDASGNLRARKAFVADVVAWLARASERIAKASLEDFLPEERVVESGAAVTVPSRCTDFHVPPPGTTSDGLVDVFAFSLRDPSNVDAEVIVGRADVIYENADALLVAQADYRWQEYSGLALQETAIHRFDLAGLSTTYAASGSISGIVPSSFALDESAGIVRVAATEDRPTTPIDPGTPSVRFVPTTPTSRVATLARVGDRLVQVGATSDLAPGERLQGVRFLGDRAYVVTFRQVDPLFVVDVSNASAPTVLGEVEIPGFSTYVHPLDATHLLTIGRDVDPVTQQDLGLSLQIFDVANPAAPTRTHRLVRPGWSGAAWDHKAFVYDSVHSVLAIPVESYGATFESSLTLFSVSTDTGLAELGSIVHTGFFGGCLDPAAPGAYVCGYPASVRRGLFVQDDVFTVSYGGVTAHALANLAVPLATVALPTPTFPLGYGYPFGAAP